MNDYLSKGEMLLIIGVILLIIPIVLESYNTLDKPIIKQVNCYDRFGNEIAELKCYEEQIFTSSYETFRKFLIFEILIGFAFIVGATFNFMKD